MVVVGGGGFEPLSLCPVCEALLTDRGGRPAIAKGRLKREVVAQAFG